MRTQYRSAFAVASGFCVSTPVAPAATKTDAETAPVRPTRKARPAADATTLEVARLEAA